MAISLNTQYKYYEQTGYVSAAVAGVGWLALAAFIAVVLSNHFKWDSDFYQKDIPTIWVGISVSFIVGGTGALGICSFKTFDLENKMNEQNIAQQRNNGQLHMQHAVQQPLLDQEQRDIAIAIQRSLDTATGKTEGMGK